MRKGKKIICGLIVVLILFLVGLTYLYNKPKTIFALSIKNAYKDLLSFSSNIKSSRIAELSKDNVVISKFNIDFDLKLEEEIDDYTKGVFDFIDKLKFKIETGRDPLNEKSMVKLTSTYETESLLNVFYYQLKDQRYLYFKDVYNKFIQLEDEEKEIDNLEELTYLFDKVFKLFNESLKDKDFSKTTVKLKTGDKTVNANKITFTLNEERLNEIFIYVLKGIKNDQESMESIIKLYNGSNSDLITQKKLTIVTLEKKIDELIKEAEEQSTENKDEIKISVYVKGWFNTVIGYELSYPDTNNFNESSDQNLVLNYITYSNQDKKIVKEFKMETEEQVSNFILTKEEEGKYKYQTSSDFKNKDLNDYENINYSGEISLIEEVIKIDQEYKQTGLISINIEKGDKKVGSFKINLDIETKIGGKLNDIKVSNVIKQDQLSKEEILEIYFDFLEPFVDKLLLVMGFNNYGEPNFEWDPEFDDDFEWDDEWDDDFDFDESY
ncbi:MAG: hypothetical protein ACOXZR_02070 [Bacilli bacterium]|jgi:hypothetical protein